MYDNITISNKLRIRNFACCKNMYLNLDTIKIYSRKNLIRLNSNVAPSMKAKLYIISDD